MTLSTESATGASATGVAPAPLGALLQTLERVIHGHQRMLTVLQREKQAIATGNLDEVHACLAEKDTLVVQLRAEEASRIDHARRAAECLGLGQRDASLSELGAVAPPPFAEGLRACRDRLTSLVASIQELNQLNGILIDRVLTQVGSLVTLLKHLMAPAPVYGAGGALCESPRGGRVLGTG